MSDPTFSPCCNKYSTPVMEPSATKARCVKCGEIFERGARPVASGAEPPPLVEIEKALFAATDPLDESHPFDIALARHIRRLAPVVRDMLARVALRGSSSGAAPKEGA